MKRFSKLVSGFLLALLFISFFSASTVYANSQSDSQMTNFDSIKENVDSFSPHQAVVVDEIAYVEMIRSYTEDELYDMGCSENEVSYILNYDYNQQLMRLASQSTEELKQKGYSNEQIDTLKRYDGTTDAVDYVAANSLSNAVLDFNYSCLSASNNIFGFYWYAQWSSCPIFTGTDIVAFTWMAADSNSTIIAMRYNGSPTCSADYYDNLGNYFTTNSIAQSGEIGKLYFNIPINMIPQLPDYWCKRMSGSFYIMTQSSSYNISTLQILGNYGHSTMTIWPSVTFGNPPTLSIGYTWSMQNLSPILRTYNNSGYIIGW